MSYLPHTQADREHMLEVVGVPSVEDLFASIPPTLRLGRDRCLPEALTEHDLLEHLGQMASRNQEATRSSFLGAGAYRHFVPTLVETVTSRSEFLTAYTPYQAEASQGTLQAIFEFQTMICRLTGMDVANASVYDGGMAVTDAVLMALAQTRRSKVLVSRGVHPHTREILATYLAAGGGVVEEIPLHEGRTEVPQVGADVAAVVVQVPNFLGQVEDGPALCQAARQAGALAVVAVNDPVSLAVLEAPGAYGADLVCGEAQPVGLPLSFGGPYVGFLAARKDLLRRMPGRLVGLTADGQGRRGFCLTLQAREQHIRREKASSNICSNQGLCALAVTVHLALLGPEGLRRCALGSMNSAAFARERLARVPGFSLAFSGAGFHEFVLRCPAPPEQLLEGLAERGILGGYALGRDYPELADGLLVCCTELTRRQDVEGLALELEALVQAPVEVTR